MASRKVLASSSTIAHGGLHILSSACTLGLDLTSLCVHHWWFTHPTNFSSLWFLWSKLILLIVCPLRIWLTPFEELFQFFWATVSPFPMCWTLLEGRRPDVAIRFLLLCNAFAPGSLQVKHFLNWVGIAIDRWRKTTAHALWKKWWRLWNIKHFHFLL